MANGISDTDVVEVLRLDNIFSFWGIGQCQKSKKEGKDGALAAIILFFNTYLRNF